MAITAAVPSLLEAATDTDIVMTAAATVAVVTTIDRAGQNTEAIAPSIGRMVAGGADTIALNRSTKI